jgi:hypothetical protein
MVNPLPFFPAWPGAPSAPTTAPDHGTMGPGHRTEVSGLRPYLRLPVIIRVQSILDTSDFDKNSETSFILLLNIISSPDHHES